MGITNPIEIANDEYENSIRLTQNLTKMIINQDRFGSIDENKMNEIKKSIAKERELKQKEQLKSILDSEDLTEIERKKDRNMAGARGLKLANSTPIKRSRFQPK